VLAVLQIICGLIPLLMQGVVLASGQRRVVIHVTVMPLAFRPLPRNCLAFRSEVHGVSGHLHRQLPKAAPVVWVRCCGGDMAALVARGPG
jgi:hypothetical protein